MTVLDQSHSVPLGDESTVGLARRSARAAAEEAGLDEVVRERVAIVATEAARNAVRHGGGGELVVRHLPGGALELLAIDSGKGIADVPATLRDGYSTAGTRGEGLGAIARLSDVFDIWSAPGRGTALVARFGAHGAPDGLAVGAVCLPVDGERECGDAWTIVGDASRAVAAVADGLGHGPLAAEASRAAISSVRRSASLGAPHILEQAHAALRATRGAAVAVAELHLDRDRIAYAGLGNIAGAVLSSADPPRRMVSLAGTVGHEARRIQDFEYGFAPGDTVVLHSDGLGTHWDLAAYPGLAARDPALVAGVLYRDHRRRRDDVTVVVVRRST